MGLATAGTLALGRRAGAAADTPEPGPYGPFKMGIQSYSLRHFGFDDALAHTKMFGLHYWESYPAHISPNADADRRDMYKKHAAAAGVKVVGFGVSAFGKDHDANRKLFEFAKAMGIEYLSADPSRDAFDSLDKLVEEYGIPIGIHNHGPGHQYAMIDAIAKAIKDHHPKIGCCIDTGHFLRSKEDPVRAVEVFDTRIYGVHLKDVKDAKTFTVLGEGDLRTAELLRALAQRKYNYCLALEYEEHPTAPDEDILKSLAAVRKAVAGL
jgi:sugar phosphate isomerase/epimerase